jgi:hypothetical protein
MAGHNDGDLLKYLQPLGRLVWVCAVPRNLGVVIGETLRRLSYLRRLPILKTFPLKVTLNG